MVLGAGLILFPNFLKSIYVVVYLKQGSFYYKEIRLAGIKKKKSFEKDYIVNGMLIRLLMEVNVFCANAMQNC